MSVSMVQEQYAGKLDEKGRDFLRRVVRGGGRMRQLLDDLLTLTRVQQGRPAPEYISLTDVTLEALSRLDMKVRERNAIIRLESPLPQVRADRTWVTQAVYNVLDNALKFRQGDAPPEIDIEAFRPERPGDDVAGIVIQDRGPGIPDGLEEKIFQMFQRGVGREVEGTGAGLAIVRQIAERHNGRAFVRARKGGGSEFVITFGLTEEVKS
jgi:signal transduction histidine kinase